MKKTLFDSEINQFADTPLATRMRPRTLDEYIGQRHLIAEGKWLNRAIEAKRLTSVILYGPPGVGKTTLALCLCHQTQSYFEQMNAVSSTVDDMRKVINAAMHRRANFGQRTVLFIDEIHRFNKAQQDVLMPDMEAGHIILVGATVLNPFAALNTPLISRSVVMELKALSAEDLITLLNRAIKDKERGLGLWPIDIDEEAIKQIAVLSDGDARKALNTLEIAAVTTPPNAQGRIYINTVNIEESIQKKSIAYDRDGDQHYDTISAFIKSMRGSDPDAAVYWLAKMIYGGEDPRFIARRIVICASEDVGNADPHALVLAQAAMLAVETIGMPEGRIILAQAAIYVAAAPKSNACYLAIDKALDDIKHQGIQQVPAHLQDMHFKKKENISPQDRYKYAHDYPQHYVKQAYKPHDTVYYEPTALGYEAKIKERLEKLKQL